MESIPQVYSLETLPIESPWTLEDNLRQVRSAWEIEVLQTIYPEQLSLSLKGRTGHSFDQKQLKLPESSQAEN